MLNVLSSFIAGHERVVTIEDAAELTLRQRHVVRLETRPPNIEGKGAVRQRQLVINALRMRPDRIIVGEVRGEEALDMLQAMNTGHDGSLTTIHANSPRDALYRLDTMIAMANLNIPDKAVRQQVASAVNIVIQVTRLADGTRRVTSISEITGMEQDVIAMQEIFSFQQSGIDKDGQGRRQIPGDRHSPQVRRQDRRGRHVPADGHVLSRASGQRGTGGAEVLMAPVVLTFVVTLLLIVGAYWLLVVRPEEQVQDVIWRRLTLEGPARQGADRAVEARAATEQRAGVRCRSSSQP